MINQQVIKKFLARKTNNYDWLKQCTEKDILDDLHLLNPKPDFGSAKPWQHQLSCFLLLLELKRFMFHIDMGGGKTLLTLMLAHYRKQRGEKFKAVVFVPYLTSVETWVDECQKHMPSLHCVPLLGTGKANRARLNGPGDVFVVCYQSATAMVTDTAFDPKRGKNKWVLKTEQVRNYFSGFDMMVADEVHRCMSHNSLVYRMCSAVSAQCEYVLGLTGTPFGKDLIALWPQFNLIDFGETLGPNISFYREVFFAQRRNYWGGFEFIFRKKRMRNLKRMIKHKSIHYNINELHDLPQKIMVRKTLPQPNDAQGYTSKVWQELKIAIKQGGYRKIENSYLQLRQLASGFMTLKPLEGDDKMHVRFDNNPKLEALVDLIEAMPEGRKMVVFHHFVYTGEIISERLKQLKLSHARIWGGQKDKIGHLRKFKNDPACTIMVLNDKSGSSSLNLQVANYCVFFEQPDSPITRQQAERRLWRPGQTERVLIYDLLVRDTVDIRLNKANKAGENLLQQLLRGKL